MIGVVAGGSRGRRGVSTGRPRRRGPSIDHLGRPVRAGLGAGPAVRSGADLDRCVTHFWEVRESSAACLAAQVLPPLGRPHPRPARPHRHDGDPRRVVRPRGRPAGDPRRAGRRAPRSARAVAPRRRLRRPLARDPGPGRAPDLARAGGGGGPGRPAIQLMTIRDARPSRTIRPRLDVRRLVVGVRRGRGEDGGGQTGDWRARRDSNPRPSGPQPDALSAELRAHAIGPGSGGEGGIRTLEAGYPTWRFSKPLH